MPSPGDAQFSRLDALDKKKRGRKTCTITMVMPWSITITTFFPLILNATTSNVNEVNPGMQLLEWNVLEWLREDCQLIFSICVLQDGMELCVSVLALSLAMVDRVLAKCW